MTRDQLIAEKNRELAWFKSRCADLESQLEAGRRINYEKETRCAELEAELNQLKTCEYVPRSMYKQLKAENAALLDSYPEGMTPTDVRKLKGYNAELAAENTALREEINRLDPCREKGHQYAYFGSQKQRRCNRCSQLEPQQPAPGGE